MFKTDVKTPHFSMGTEQLFPRNNYQPDANTTKKVLRLTRSLHDGKRRIGVAVGKDKST